VIIGSALHLLIQVPGLIHYQFHWSPVLEWKSAGVQRVIILLGPRVLTMACIQAYFVARDNLGSHFGAVGVGALNLAWTIEQVPETIIGTAMAVAILPSLAEYINRSQTADFTKTINRALRVMLALCLPAAVLLALSVRPLAQSFFGYDNARLDLLTACTWAFLIGLVGDTWLEVAVRSYYANQNTRTPLVAAFIQTVTFILLSLILSQFIGLAGIPLSAALTFTTQAIVLLAIMNRKYPGVLDVGNTALRAIASSLVALIITLFVYRYIPLPLVARTFAGLLIGGLACLPLIWREVRQLFNM
jgi:putative peptidoglycan lipid II flippase